MGYLHLWKTPYGFMEVKVKDHRLTAIEPPSEGHRVGFGFIYIYVYTYTVYIYIYNDPQTSPHSYTVKSHMSWYSQCFVVLWYCFLAKKTCDWWKNGIPEMIWPIPRGRHLSAGRCIIAFQRGLPPLVVGHWSVQCWSPGWSFQSSHATWVPTQYHTPGPWLPWLLRPQKTWWNTEYVVDLVVNSGLKIRWIWVTTINPWKMNGPTSMELTTSSQVIH